MFGLARSDLVRFKGSPDRSHFIFEINVGKSRIRHRTTLNLNDVVIDIESIEKLIIQFQRRCLSVPPLSDIDLKNKTAWVLTTLKIKVLTHLT